ncbi:MAG: type II secretion system protein [Pseudomonadota bacterium]
MYYHKLLRGRRPPKKMASNLDGFSLLEALVTISIMSIAGFALTSLNVTGMKANKSNYIRADLLDVKRTITNQLSCDQTLGATKPTSITGAVTLKDKNGNPLIGTSGKIGEWTIDAAVETLGTPSLPGLSIYATKPGKTDPLRNIPLNRDHPLSALFNPDVRLCGDNFKSSTGGEIMPLYGNYTGQVAGASAINALLRKGIELGWNATFNPSTGTWSTPDAQLNWDQCRAAQPADAITEQLFENPGCQHRICNAHFRNKSNPMNVTPAGWCGKTPRDASGNPISTWCYRTYGLDVPALNMGCMWTKEAFDANKVP